jgi:hypothetical protein
MKNAMRTYYVASYVYNDGCKGIACARFLDVLPPTCLVPIRRISAKNAKDAIKAFRVEAKDNFASLA